MLFRTTMSMGDWRSPPGTARGPCHMGCTGGEEGWREEEVEKKEIKEKRSEKFKVWEKNSQVSAAHENRTENKNPDAYFSCCTLLLPSFLNSPFPNKQMKKVLHKNIYHSISTMSVLDWHTSSFLEPFEETEWKRSKWAIVLPHRPLHFFLKGNYKIREKWAGYTESDTRNVLARPQLPFTAGESDQDLWPVKPPSQLMSVNGPDSYKTALAFPCCFLLLHLCLWKFSKIKTF